MDGRRRGDGDRCSRELRDGLLGDGPGAVVAGGVASTAGAGGGTSAAGGSTGSGAGG